MIDEEKLIIQAKNGQQESFGALYDKYIKQIYRFTLLKVSSREEAEDLTHEVFLSAWQNIKAYQSRGFPFSSWLYQIARNKIIDHYRSKNVNVADIEDVEESQLAVDDVVYKTDVALTFENVQDAIARLNQDQQDVLIMRYIEDMPYDEIAKTINKSEGAVRLIQHRAVQSLKKIVFERDQQKRVTES